MAVQQVGENSQNSIPFYRNVKVIGNLAQGIFLILVLVGLAFLVRNVIINAREINITLGFDWLATRAGIPLSESPIPYDQNIHFYRRAIFVGFLNTLKVSLIGMVLATLLGVGTALMRLSNNWVLRQVATFYIEIVRNIPLAVQIFFWYTVLFIPSLPIGGNGFDLGQGILNNSGIAMPWPYYTQNAVLWLPWLIGALVLAIIVFFIRRRQIILSERPGNPWILTLLAFVVVSLVGYFVADNRSTYPENLALNFKESSGRFTSYIDANQDEAFTSRTEETVRAIPIIAKMDEGTLTSIPDKRKEANRTVYSSFRFPLIKESEFEEAEVTFINPENAEGLSIHYNKFPSVGQIYKDRNGNGVFDKGEAQRTQEEIDASGTPEDGYEGINYQVQMTVKNFERHLVTDNDGETKLPKFKGDNINTRAELKSASPFAWSKPSFPTERTGIVGGQILTNAYLALLIALVIYTASFIAEIVRGGILSVPKGQREAAQAVGLNGSQTFNLVVLPQAMRIVIPPMISQYLNLAKNSSLGLFCAYPEFFKVSEIITGQSGGAVPMVIILIAGYLLISLTFSFILNIFNNRMKLVER